MCRHLPFRYPPVLRANRAWKEANITRVSDPIRPHHRSSTYSGSKKDGQARWPCVALSSINALKAKIRGPSFELVNDLLDTFIRGEAVRAPPKYRIQINNEILLTAKPNAGLVQATRFPAKRPPSATLRSGRYLLSKCLALLGDVGLRVPAPPGALSLLRHLDAFDVLADRLFGGPSPGIPKTSPPRRPKSAISPSF